MIQYIHPIYYILSAIVAGSSELDHIKPRSSESGLRGRMPKYRLGRYGPHSKDVLIDTEGSAIRDACTSSMAAMMKKEINIARRS